MSFLAENVFIAATADWPHGLKGNDANEVFITKNVLGRWRTTV